MGYSRVYYHSIYDITTEASSLGQKWTEKLSKISEKVNAFSGDKYSFQGTAAQNTKDYMSEVHGFLLMSLLEICAAYSAKALTYYSGYYSKVDSGQGMESFKTLHTTIVHDEVKSGGSVEKKLKKIRSKAEDVNSAALRVSNSVRDLVSLPSPKLTELQEAVRVTAQIAKDLDSRVDSYEGSRKGDFTNLDRLISAADQLIRTQLSQSRRPVVAYQSGQITQMCNFQDMWVSLQAVDNEYSLITQDPEFEVAIQLASMKEEYQKQEDQESRKWVKWAKIGIAVIATAALIVCTAGVGLAATVVIGGVIGAVEYGSYAALDAYYEDGSIDREDWSKIGREALVGGVKGMVSGYFGKVGGGLGGEVLKKPMQKALEKAGASFTGNVLGTAAGTIWDVGEAYITRKPGEDVDAWAIVKGNFEKTAKSLVVDTATDFVTGYFGAKLNIGGTDKTHVDKFLDKTKENLVGGGVRFVAGTAWDIGTEAIIDKVSFSDQDILGKMWDNAKDAGTDFVRGEISAGVSEMTDFFKDKIGDSKLSKDQKKFWKSSTEIGGGYLESFASNFGGLVLDNLLDGKGLKFEGDQLLDTTIESIKAGSKNAMKEVLSDYQKEKELNRKLRELDTDKDGYIQVVTIDTPDGKRVTFSTGEYEKALELAGKGDYKDMNAAQILGLPKDTKVDVDSVKVRNVRYDRLQKNKWDGKTKVTKDGKEVEETLTTDATRFAVTNKSHMPEGAEKEGHFNSKGEKLAENAKPVIKENYYQRDVYTEDEMSRMSAEQRKEAEAFNEKYYQTGKRKLTFDSLSKDSDSHGFDTVKGTEDVVLEEGTVFSRYGSNRGQYATDKGESYDSLGLPYVEDTVEYHEYIVLKPLPCTSGFVAENFESAGGGKQYYFDKNIKYLLRNGYIKEV